MRVLVIGCGRVGSRLAGQLAVEGHDVRVTDHDPRARERLPEKFSGRFLVGGAFSRTVLESAGVGEAAAVVAVTADDNANVVAARVAKEVYRVPTVIARTYEPHRADIYRGLGIPTVASVRWTVSQIHRMLLHRNLSPEATFGNGETLLVRSTLPDHLTGRPLADLEVDGEIRVVEVTRGGRSQVPALGTGAEPGDLVSFAVSATALDALRTMLDRELGS